MKPFISVMLMVILIPGCGEGRSPASPEAAAPIVLDAPAEFTVMQRSTTPLPGSDGSVLLTIDDITADQVMATISWEDGRTIMGPRSLRQADVVGFSAGEHAYKIELKLLMNVLVGDDSASFRLWPEAIEQQNALSETEKIEALIESISRLEGAAFIRNGEEHSLEDAISHMRMKWDWKRSDIKTARDFIEHAASNSSTTGNPYLIRMADGAEVKAEDWLLNRLNSMENHDDQAAEQGG